MKWIITAKVEGKNGYRVLDAFNELKYVNWSKSKITGNIKVGDTVYIYVGRPYMKVMIETVCVNNNIVDDTFDDRNYWNVPRNYKVASSGYFQLQHIKTVDDGLLSLQTLKTRGYIKENVRGALKSENNPELFSYINSIFKQHFNSKARIMEYGFLEWVKKLPQKEKSKSVYKKTTISQYINAANKFTDAVMGSSLFSVDDYYSLRKTIDINKNFIDYCNKKAGNGACKRGLEIYLEFLEFRKKIRAVRCCNLKEMDYELIRKKYIDYLNRAVEIDIYTKANAENAKSDSFYIYRHNDYDINHFLYVALNDDFEEKARETLDELLAKDSKALKPDVSSYIRYLGYFRDFAYDGDIILDDGIANEVKMDVKNFDLNTILYGPPGTGKTYNSVIYAVAICDRRSLEEVYAEPYENVINRFNELKSEGRIAFTTFHQSYGYEEFIEGIKPSIEENSNGFSYIIESGIFKSFCDKAKSVEFSAGQQKIDQYAKVWKITIKNGEMNQIKKECFDENNIRMGFDIDSPEARSFVEDVNEGDIILSLKTRKTIDGIAVVTGEAVKLENKDCYSTARPVKWLAKDINEDIIDINNGKMLHRMTFAKVPYMNINGLINLVKKVNPNTVHTIAENKIDPYVFIIDEINRGNISKIFGELITLIEQTKREGMIESASSILPYSGVEFSVPNNVYILGTMNTADRSIASMDTALRRRFNFVEMMPDESLFEGIEIENIKIRDMLDMMNKRITALFDREHTLGHAFFLSLRKEATIEKLADIFRNNIIPLLQEYFYDDYEKIRMVLGDNQKKNKDNQFITVDYGSWTNLFGESSYEQDGYITYRINKKAFENNNSYISIYSGEEA